MLLATPTFCILDTPANHFVRSMTAGPCLLAERGHQKYIFEGERLRGLIVILSFDGYRQIRATL